MRKTVVTEFVTLDGIMEDPGGSEKTKDGGWAFKFGREPEGDQFKMDEMLKSRLFIDRSDMHTLHLVDAKPLAKVCLSLSIIQKIINKLVLETIQYRKYRKFNKLTIERGNI